MLTFEDFEGQDPAWCPGCGNFNILKCLKESFVELDLCPERIMMVSGIGQGAKMPHYTKCNTFNGLHGRTLPVATGIKLVNGDLTVIAVAGDGDCYGEGGNHLIHTIRKNPDITMIVCNNQIYGLTKGQASPTSAKGTISKIQPSGSTAEPMNPLSLAIALDCSFVARGFAGNMEQLKKLIKEAIKHKGFSLLDILQPCISFNKINTYSWYKERVYDIEKDGVGKKYQKNDNNQMNKNRMDKSKINKSKIDKREQQTHDPFDRMKAFELSLEFGDRIPTGIIYKNSRATLRENIPVIKEKNLVDMKFEKDSVKKEINKFC